MNERFPLKSDFYGHLAELKVLTRAAARGVVASLPTTPARYDIIIEEGGLHRCQVKWGELTPTHSSGAVAIDLRKGDKKRRLYEDGEVDALLVYVQPVDKVCWFGPEQFCGKTGLTVRYAPTKNNMKRGCLFVEDFEW